MEVYEVIVCENKTEWWQNGKRHHLNGPAIEWKDGTKFWYQDGKLHRLDGPAIEWNTGTKFWYQNGRLHRLDGPAIEGANGHKEYWIKGEELTEEEFNARSKPCFGKKLIIDGIEYTLS